MKNTPLSEIHALQGAKMAEFAGYNMPIVYTTISQEHEAVRARAGVFDVSHMGEFMVKGPEALEFLQLVTSNDVSKLVPGQAQYSCMPNKDGGIVDDLLVYKLFEDNSYMLVVNGANIDKDWQWLQSNIDHDIEMTNASDDIGLLAVQGPQVVSLLQSLTDKDLSSIGFYHFDIGTLAGIENTIISGTGYTGSGGFELYVPAAELPKLWQALMDLEIPPAGLGARDTLRLEMGYCLYGNDITDTTSPIEAGLGWITKLKKGDFNSSQIFSKQKEDGVTRKLVGFTLDDRRVPRNGYTIENESGEVIGEVTSGTQSPTLDHPIGMGYVDVAYSKTGTPIWICRGNKRFDAIVKRPPFVNIEG